MEGEAQDDKVYDIVVNLLLALGVAVNVYLIVDSASDGELSRQVGKWWQHSIVRRVNVYRDYQRDRTKIVGVATWLTMETEGNDNERSDSATERKD